MDSSSPPADGNSDADGTTSAGANPTDGADDPGQTQNRNAPDSQEPTGTDGFGDGGSDDTDHDESDGQGEAAEQPEVGEQADVATDDPTDGADNLPGDLADDTVTEAIPADPPQEPQAMHTGDGGQQVPSQPSVPDPTINEPDPGSDNPGAVASTTKPSTDRGPKIPEVEIAPVTPVAETGPSAPLPASAEPVGGVRKRSVNLPVLQSFSAAPASAAITTNPNPKPNPVAETKTDTATVVAPLAALGSALLSTDQPGGPPLANTALWVVGAAARRQIGNLDSAPPAVDQVTTGEPANVTLAALVEEAVVAAVPNTPPTLVLDYVQAPSWFSGYNSYGDVDGSDADGDALTYSVAQSTKGTVTINSSGGLKFTPTAAARHAASATNATAADKSATFAVTVTDTAGATATIDVTVAVASANKAPTSATYSLRLTDPGTGQFTIPVSAMDPDGDTLTFSAPATTSRGAITNLQNGSFVYTPTRAARTSAATGLPRLDSFRVTITDGHGGTTTKTVEVVIAPLNSDATVFTLAGTAGDPVAVAKYLKGEVTEGRTVVPIEYPNLRNDIDPDIQEGARRLNEQLTTTTGKKIVYAHSLGAVVASAWLHLYGPTSSVSPNDVEFVLIGNSVRPYNGFYPLNNFTRTTGVPFVNRNLVSPITDTRYKVRDIAIQYDGWADWPNQPTSIAVSNANAGKNIYHLMYTRFPYHRADYVEYVEGNITYVWIPVNQWWSSASRLATIETAYNRPGT